MEMDILVGYTGFVGSNLQMSYKFDELYNSKNINEAFNKNPDLLVYSGVRAEKFLANKEPELDKENINIAIENIKKINPRRLVLISTIDVYKTPFDVFEDTEIITQDLCAYGLNRYYLECWVEENVKNYNIIRLPGLYGENIKKNFIFDLINVIPSMLNENKFKELFSKDNLIKDYYILQDNGFYKCKALTENENKLLKNYFKNIGFSAVNFTDSRSSFQFYNLKYLWEHIQTALKYNIKKLNIATEPIKVSELYKFIKDETFFNENLQNIPNYNFKTKYYELFNGQNGYIFNKDFIMKDIKNFIVVH